MKHLSEESLVDLVEGRTSGLDHVATCAVCRERLDDLRQMTGLLRADQVPEPSPLFWKHFSQRVRSAIDAEPNPSPSRAVPRWAWALAAVAGALVVGLLIFPVQQTSESERIAGGSATRPAAEIALDDGNPANDVSWAAGEPEDAWLIVVDVVQDLDLESAADAGIFVRPGSIEQAVLMLSEEERRELTQLIQAELDRSIS